MPASSQDLEMFLSSLTRFDTICTLESGLWISISYVMLISVHPRSKRADNERFYSLSMV